MHRESRKGGETFDADGVSKTTKRYRHNGARMVQSLLKEMGLGDFETWAQELVAAGMDAEGAYPAVGRMWAQLLKKVQANELLHMPDSRYGGTKRGGEYRQIYYSFLKEIIFALKEAINQAKDGGLAVDDGHFQKYKVYKKLEPLLAKRKKEAKKETGDEAVQRRNKCFTDQEQVDLFASILRCDVEKRHAIDSATLGVITALFMQLGKRGMSIDAVKQGNMENLMWNEKVWDFTSPIVLQLATAAKGDKADSAMSLEQVMHHRCPMRDSMSWLGLYFSYQFFTDGVELPTMETWKSDAMHDRPLIVQYRKNRPISDTAAAVTAFNSKLQENLAIVGADPSITFHYFRSLLSNQASQLGADYLDVTHGIGHGSAYTKNYQVTVGTMTLFYAGYKHLDDAEKMGAWVQVLYQELDGLCCTLVDLLYAQWAPNGAQLLALEKEVAAVLASGVDQTTGAGKAAKRMSRWLKMVRLCIASWIVSCAARPRDRYSWIDEASPTKRELVDTELRAHLEPIFRTDAYAQMAAIVRQKEEEEIGMGELAHRTGTECRSRSQMTGMERRLVDLPTQVAASVRQMGSGEEDQRKAAECKELGRRVLDIMRPRHEDPGGETFHGQSFAGKRWSDFDAMESLRQPGDDDLAVIERSIRTDCEDDDELSDRQCEWIQRLRQLTSEGFESGLERTVMKSALTCDQCIAQGATGLCKGHGTPTKATAASSSALAVCFVKPDAATNKNGVARAAASVASTSTAIVATTGLSVSPSSTSLGANVTSAPVVDIANAASAATSASAAATATAPLAALADPTVDVARAMPQTLEELTTVRQALRQWLSVIAPQERRGPAHAPAWRSTATLGDRKHMRKWGHQVNENYYPILFCVMEKYESGMGLVEAADAVESDKGGAEWSGFLSKLPTRVNHPKVKEYTEMLLDRDGKLMAGLTSTAVTKSVTPPTAPPESSDAAAEAAPSISEVEGATRYLAFDPALSCGWAILQVKEGRLVSVDCGIIQVDTSSTVLGDRLNDLKLQLQPLLSPAPSIVFVESYHGQNSQHRREQTDVISYSLRAVIAMEASSRGITLEEVAPQSWKVAIGVAGNEADKSVIKAKLEATFSTSFPAKMPNPNGGRSINFKHDASDATGIGLWGVQKHHSALSFMALVPISMPSLSREAPAMSAVAPATVLRRASKQPIATTAATAAAASVDERADEEADERHDAGADAELGESPSKRTRVDFNDILNRRVKKTFASHGDFLGTIMTWDADAKWYAIDYDDGTSEDVTRVTALRLIKRFDQEEL